MGTGCGHRRKGLRDSCHDFEIVDTVVRQKVAILVEPKNI
jgi:hypothetical protein